MLMILYDELISYAHEGGQISSIYSRGLLVDPFIDLQFNQPKKYSVAVVRKRTIPTERQPLVGEVGANL
jgi:hypothetical protein